MAAPLKTSSRTRYGLIALLAIRQARAIRERREREAAERQQPTTAETLPKPKKRGWFG